MTFETELRDQLHAGVDDTDVDLGPLLAGGVAYGNKLVRRRRLTRIFAAAATIAVLGGAFAYTGSLADPAGSSVNPAGTITDQRQKKADITPQAALRVLLDNLPAKGPATNFRGGFDGMGSVLGVYAVADYGSASIRVEVIKSQYPLQCLPTDSDCKVTILPDGSRLRTLKMSIPGPKSNDESLQLQANLTRKDGLNLNLIAVNTIPAQPAITLAQLKTIATSPHWQLQLDQSILDGSDRLFVPRLVTQPSAPEPSR